MQSSEVGSNYYFVCNVLNGMKFICLNKCNVLNGVKFIYLDKFHATQNITNKIIIGPHLRTLHVFRKLVELGDQLSNQSGRPSVMQEFRHTNGGEINIHS
jgi:hypothetical protein